MRVCEGFRHEEVTRATEMACIKKTSNERPKRTARAGLPLLGSLHGAVASLKCVWESIKSHFSFFKLKHAVLELPSNLRADKQRG